MCIGLPMRIVSTGPGHAVCDGMGERKQVDTLLVGEQPIGTWVMVFLDSAREVLTEQQAKSITQAVEALNLAMQGETNVDHLFQDLIDREPQLPSFLQTKETLEQES